VRVSYLVGSKVIAMLVSVAALSMGRELRATTDREAFLRGPRVGPRREVTALPDGPGESVYRHLSAASWGQGTPSDFRRVCV
jgi:hypothetical protein